MEPEAFLNSRDPVYEFIYNNESELEPLQYPLAFSRYRVPRFANQLYSDDDSQYFTYSGSNSVIVTKEKEGRYKNLTLRAYSGDSFKFYFQVGSGIADSDAYFSGPLTTSGVYSTMTLYTTQSGALANAITFSAPTNNSSVYTLPNIQNLNWIRLYHNSVDGTTPYRIYQFIPRTLIQVDDLEADVIDVVSLRVSGSIVVTADNLANGSITGAKIMAGTVSGVLITPGTITANEISAGTITANKLNVTQLDAVAANMGTLVVNSGITVGTEGYIWTGTGSAANPTDGLKIYTTSGVSRLTTFSGGIAQVDIDSDGKLYVGSGQTLRLDSTGVRFKTSAISGEPLFSGGRVDDNGVITTVIPPAQNIIKFHPYNYTGNYPSNPDVIFTEDLTDSATFFIENSEIYDPRIIDESYYLGSYARLRSGWRPTESTFPMYKKIVDSVLELESFSSSVSKISLNAHGFSSARINLVGAPPLGGPGIYMYGQTSISGTLTTSGNIQTYGQLLTASGLSSGGSVFSLTTPRINYAENSGKPTLIITGSGTSGTSGSITLNNSSVATPGQKQGYINMDANNTLEVTNQVTNGNMHLNLPNDGNLRVYVNSPANPQLLVDSAGSTVTGTLGVTGQTTLAALNASGAIGFGTSNNKFTVAAATGNTAVAGTLGVTGKITSSEMGYLTVRRTADVAITTAGTTITWQSAVRSNNISFSTDTITIDNAGYYMFSATFATVANLTSLRMTLTRGGVNYVSTLHGAGLNTGGGYLFNFNIGFFASAGSTYRVSLTPSSNTTLNANNEGFAGPSPIMNIFQAIGV
jgi:hypothetical protein